MKVIDLEYTKNTRDIGGMKTQDGRQIKYNLLYRSGHLHRLSNADIKTLESLKIDYIIDFRSENEFINKADYKFNNTQYINIPVLKKEEKKGSTDYKNNADANLLRLVNKDTGGSKKMISTYKEIVTSKKGITAYQKFFRLLEDNTNKSFLWHCSQGKDRAGLAAFFLEYALGVSMDDCVADYMYTNIAMVSKVEQLTPIVLRISNNDTSLLKELKEVFSAKEDYLNAALDAINQTYGSLDNFLYDTLKVDKEKLQKNYVI